MTDPVIAQRRDALAAVKRQQIIDAFAQVALEKTYAATTIADIARVARVSKSTFYENFPDKEAVYVALHAQVADAIARALTEVRAHQSDNQPWQDRVRALVRAHLEAIASQPAHLAQVAIEPQIASPTARQLKLDAAQRFTALCIDLTADLSHTTDQVAPIPETVARAAMAATVEFEHEATLEGPDAVRALEDPLTDIWIRLIRRPQ